MNPEAPKPEKKLLKLLKPKKPINNPALSFGTNFAGGMGLLCGGGWWLDNKYDTSPKWILIGAFIGFIFGAYELWKVVRWLQEKDRRDSQEAAKKDDH